jgi:hypothetical protein
MDEKAIEQWLCDVLRSGRGDSEYLRAVSIANSTSDARTLLDLVGNCPFEVFQDTSDWNTHPELMMDIIGGMTPDVVLRSTVSGENRIIIEVKRYQSLGYGTADSQIIRYFLHLLATSSAKSGIRGPEIRRAVLLAAPSHWFEEPKNSKAWGYFTNTYEPLASHFGITLGELRLPEGEPNPRLQSDCLQASPSGHR